MSANRVCASFFLPLSSCMFSRCCGLVSLPRFSCILFTAEFYVILYSLRLEASQLSLWRGVSISYSIHWCIAADGHSCSVLAVSLVFIALCGIGQRLHCVAGGCFMYTSYIVPFFFFFFVAVGFACATLVVVTRVVVAIVIVVAVAVV